MFGTRAPCNHSTRNTAGARHSTVIRLCQHLHVAGHCQEHQYRQRLQALLLDICQTSAQKQSLHVNSRSLSPSPSVECAVHCTAPGLLTDMLHPRHPIASHAHRALGCAPLPQHSHAAAEAQPCQQHHSCQTAAWPADQIQSPSWSLRGRYVALRYWNPKLLSACSRAAGQQLPSGRGSSGSSGRRFVLQPSTPAGTLLLLGCHQTHAAPTPRSTAEPCPQAPTPTPSRQHTSTFTRTPPTPHICARVLPHPLN